MRSKVLINTVIAFTLIGGAAIAKVNMPPLAGDALVSQEVANKIMDYPYYTIFDIVNYQVNDGAVLLTGEVTQPWKKSALKDRVAEAPGVTSVDNELKVAPVSDFDNSLRAKIAHAIYSDPVLSRYGVNYRPTIHIIVDSGHVSLEGLVTDDFDKQVAVTRADSALAFGHVANNLEVEVPGKP